MEDVDLCDLTHVQRASHIPLFWGCSEGVNIHDLYAKGKQLCPLDHFVHVDATIATQLAIAMRVSPRNALGIITGMCDRYETALANHRAFVPMEIGHGKRIVYDAASRAAIELKRPSDAGMRKAIKRVRSIEATAEAAEEAWMTAKANRYEAQRELSDKITQVHSRSTDEV